MENNTKEKRAIIIGDSTNNTLSAVRSLGEAKINQVLILKCDTDWCHVTKSRYLKKSPQYIIKDICDCLPILDILKKDNELYDQTLICTFDEAAVFIDNHEEELYPAFRTPARGKHIGQFFNKDAQCKLAAQCGLTIPKSMDFSRNDDLDTISIGYPLLLKPLNSTQGEKSDIHICKTKQDLIQALAEESHCDNFILQEFIDKEYEIDCIGVRTDKEMFVSGGIKKIRHYPPLIGAGAYGFFQPIRCYDINLEGLEEFLKKSNYYGPFSVEFLHKEQHNYFMEVNFRNEGLAYASTAAGANLHELYIFPEKRINIKKIRSIYMMNYSVDFLYVKSGNLSHVKWIRDFIRTRCFININFKDLGPTITYYMEKIKR